MQEINKRNSNPFEPHVDEEIPFVDGLS